jgi:hypothetical protein
VDYPRAMKFSGRAPFGADSDIDLPPQCPKCGCHRIRVVGKPPESALRLVRCEDCEATSALLTRHRV